MSKRPQLYAYCLNWHITHSDAFKDLLVMPLAGTIDIELRAWNGETMPNHDGKDPLIFCMLPPPENVLKAEHRKLVWIPMWDQAQGYDEAWWKNLPKNLHIVAFSNEVHKRAVQANLPVIRLQYFKDPNTQPPTQWEHGRILHYWNRVGMVGPGFLERLCESLRIDTLLFKPEIDPRIEASKFYELPEKLGSTKVVKIEFTKKREEALKLIQKANVLLAPRLTEGVGMVFLEAMSRGCAVLAHDGPTMNEYIVDHRNGLLLSEKAYLPRRFWKSPTPPAQSSTPYLVSDIQPWQKMKKINLQKLGKHARLDTIKGFKQWEAARADYANFILS